MKNASLKKKKKGMKPIKAMLTNKTHLAIQLAKLYHDSQVQTTTEDLPVRRNRPFQLL